MFFVLQPAQNQKADIERLINDYSQNLMRLCLLILGDYQLAEEAVQDTLYNAYRHYGSFRRESSEKTWITRIAVNVCRGYMRRPSFKETSFSIPLQYMEDTAVEDAAEAVEAVTFLNMVCTLPFAYRQALLLRYYQDMSVKDIARTLHVKENTVSVRLKRAKEMLKTTLKEV